MLLLLLKQMMTGNGKWSTLKKVIVSPRKAVNVEFEENTPGEWIRVSVDKSCITTVHFSYADKDNRKETPDDIFSGLAKVSDDEAIGGLVYGLGDNRRAMGISASKYNGTEKGGLGYYELTADMKLIKKDDPETLQFIDKEFSIPQNVVTIEESSVLVIDDKGRRWRLPLGNELFSDLTNKSALRICREVATERDLFNCMGTFYELPAENADGFAKIRPVASHNFRINDYASYRGMLIITGIKPGAAEANSHIIKSEDGKAEIWAGVIDDLWKMGKPVGHGGPWKNSIVKAGENQILTLLDFMTEEFLKYLTMNHIPVTFTIEVDPVGHGPWMSYKEVTVNPGKTFEYRFPDNFQVTMDQIYFRSKKCKATALLTYE